MHARGVCRHQKTYVCAVYARSSIGQVCVHLIDAMAKFTGDCTSLTLVQTSLRSRISFEFSGRIRQTTEISLETSSLPCMCMPGCASIRASHTETQGRCRAVDSCTELASIAVCYGHHQGEIRTSMLRRVDVDVGVDCSGRDTSACSAQNTRIGRRWAEGCTHRHWTVGRTRHFRALALHE